MASKSKAVADPIHGTIDLTEIEARVVSTPVFQRLRNVRQLGLAHMVFPGADYSRFSHSLGVCHVTGRILDTLERGGVEFGPDEKQRYRLAGLLHDIGHYPFSHAMEQAIQDFQAGRLLVPELHLGLPTFDASDGASLHHETVGKLILGMDDELSDVFKGLDVAPTDITDIFTREKPPRFSNLVSSDLDADRIDFLLRTAHSTGLPFGSIDLQYLLSRIRVDSDNHICVHPKALRTVDHLLLGRYFDYQQVAFNKTVVGMELVLKDVLKELLARRYLRAAETDVKAMIDESRWASFDDAYVVARMRELKLSATGNGTVALKVRAVTERRPPRMVASTERLGDRSADAARTLLTQRRLVEEHIPRWSERFGIPPECWYVWDRPGLHLTKVGSRVPVSAAATGDGWDADGLEQAVRILNPKTDKSSVIMNDPRSLMHVLADKALYILRVYVLLGPEQNLREEIEKHIREDLDMVGWQ